MYIVCLFISYAFPLLLFSSLFPYLSLSVPLRIDPLHFQVGCHKKRLNLALVFVFILRYTTFLLIGERVLLLC